MRLSMSGERRTENADAGTVRELERIRVQAIWSGDGVVMEMEMELESEGCDFAVLPGG